MKEKEKVCWDSKTKMICHNLEIGYATGEQDQCSADSNLVLIDQKGEKKQHYKDTFRELTPNGWKQVDGNHFIKIVCCKGCKYQDLYNLREKNLL